MPEAVGRISLDALHYVIDHTPEPVGLHEQGVLIHANWPLARLLGFARVDEIVGRNLLAFVPPELRAGLVERLKTHVDPDSLAPPFETRVLRTDGSLLDVETVSSRLASEGRLLVMSSIRDISARKQAAAELLKQAAVFEHAQSVASFGIWSETLGSEAGPTWSAEAYRIFGLDPKAFTYSRERMVALFHPDDRERVLEARRQLVEEQVPFDVDYRIVRADGKQRWVRGRGDLTCMADGSWSVTGVVQDITERRALEEQLAQAQKMEAIGRLAGGIAHDFNNLLMVMMGQIGLAERRLTNPTLVEASLNELTVAVERAASLTKQLLATARRQISRPELVDFAAVLRDIQGLVGRIIGEDMVLQVELPAQPVWVHADRSQIEQVVFNLVVNARDAMPSGGELGVSVRRQAAGDDAFTPGYAVLEVRDSGTGIPAEIRERIFEPFFTTKGPSKGSGLGLSTVYAIAQQAGGRIEVESEPQTGSLFRVFWPLAPRAPRASEAPPPKLAVHEASGESLLLVEDDAQVRFVLALGLRELGYRVHSAENAEQALILLRRAETHVHVLVTDVVMPGMSGPDLAHAARGLRPQLPVVLLSGYAADHLDPGLLRDPQVRFLPKPVSVKDLAKVIREVVVGMPAPDGLA